MSTAMALSLGVTEQDVGAGDRERERSHPQWPPSAGIHCQATPVTFLEDRKECLFASYKTVSQLGSLSDKLDSYVAEVSSREFQATPVTFFDSRKEWLFESFKTLARLGLLSHNWDSYGAEAPSRESLDTARRVLCVLSSEDFAPTGIDPSADGGVCLSFRDGDWYGDIECFNSGEILAVTSEGGSNTKVWEIDASRTELLSALNRIRTFVAH